LLIFEFIKYNGDKTEKGSLFSAYKEGIKKEVILELKPNGN